MDDYTYLSQLIGEDEEVAEEERVLQAAAAAMIIYLGAEEYRALRAERRQSSRLYLCRPQLMSDPRDPSGSPWQKPYHSRSDRAFITTMGFDTETFDSILNTGFTQKWVEKSIPRDDNLPVSAPRPGRRSLDSDGALGLVLHYLNSTMREISLQQIFALIPTTVSRYIEFGLDNLLEVLRKMPDAGIYWARDEAL